MLLSVSVILPLWGTSYNWNHTVLVILCLAYLRLVLFPSSLHDVPYVRVCSFYDWVIFHCINTTLCLGTDLLIKHLDCFHLLAVVNNAARNIVLQVIGVPFSILLCSYVTVELVEHTVKLCLTLWGTENCFPQQLQHTLLPAIHKGFVLPTSAPKRIFCFIVIRTGVRWYFFVVLICICLRIGYVEHLFMCLLVICISSVEKGTSKSLAHF